MKTKLFILFIAFSSISYSQNTEILFKISPLALIDDITYPTIQTGIEFKFNNKISIYNEFGFKYRKSFLENSIDTSLVNSNGTKFKTELRYYFTGNNKLSKNSTYLGLNFFYNYENHNNQIEYNLNGDTSIILKDVFGVNKKVLGFNFIFGQQRKISKHFYIDGYVGLGIRQRTNIISNLEYDIKFDKDATVTPRHSFGLNFLKIRVDNDLGDKERIQPNLTFGIRLCYKF